MSRTGWRGFGCFVAALIFCMSLLAAGGHAATYYVATNGSDSNPGSSSQPWATLQHAVDSITAGDTVIVRSGNYAGFRKTDLSGTSVAPITIKSETPLGANINSRGPLAGHGGMVEIEAYGGGTISYWVFDGLAVNGTVATAGYGIDSRFTDHVTIKNCDIQHAYLSGIFSAFSTYIEEVNNASHNNGEHGIYNSNSGDNGHTLLNTCYNNTALKAGIQNNADVSMGGDGIMSYWLHERNTIYGQGNGYNFDGLCQSTVRNSLIYNNTSKGFSMYGGDSAVSANNNKILNNTVVGPANCYYDLIILDNGLAVQPLGHRVFNNILYSYNNVQGRGSICIATSCLADFQSDYNVVMDWFGFNDNGSQENLAAWRVRGFDVHSIQASDTALFVNPAGNDYHLLSSSPARDAGTALSAVGEDLAGMSRPQNSTYDIGCYEYVSEGMHTYAITTSSLPSGAVAVEYSQALAATGGTAPYRWSISSGSLPAGLVINGINGIIGGTATTAGTSNFTVLLTDSASATASKALSITINNAALKITTQYVPNGAQSTAYSTTLQATGGATPYSWSLNAGSLPAGLSLGSSTGVISGTPSATGTSSFTIKLTDNQSSTATQAYAIVVSVSMAVLQDGLSGYSGTRDTWLNSDYPTTNYGSGDTAHLQFGTQDRQLHKFDVSSIPVGSTINNATMYFYVSSLSGGTPAVACYRVLTHWDEMQATYNNRLTGTAWSAAGLLSGTDYVATALATPTVSSTGWVAFDVTAAVQGWVNTSYANEGVMYKETTSGHCVTRMREFATDTTLRPKLSVNYAPGNGLVITTGNLPADTLNVAYNQTLTASGGTTPYTWAVISGSLPTGLSLVAASGVISGTPSATGTSNFTVRVTDSGSLTATQALSITINAVPSITTSSLPNGTTGVSYNQTLAVSGGTAPFTWSLQSGSLPAGLSLVASTGAITGTPTSYGTSNFTAKVTDNVNASATKALSIIINPAALVITSTAVPNAALSVAYSTTLAATGGVTPYTWALASGSLPAGLSLTSGGVISGTPTATGTSSFTVRVTDNLSTTATKTLAIIVSASQVILQDGLNGYTGTSDTWLNSDYPTTNYGTGDMNVLQYTTPDRQIHKFDLSSIPSGATINAAQIWFDVQGVTGGTPTVGCYRILTHWDEMQATWSNRLTGTAWGAGGLQSGTDYVATALGTATVSSAGWVSYDITSTVQGWVNGSYVNEGVMYMETSAGRTMVYMSDYASPTTVRPKLIVNYTGGSLSITTSSLPADTVGVAYNQTLTASGGTTPYTWAVTSGSLPSGLSLGASTGAITGTPSASGTSNFTVRVTDNVAATATKALSIVINAAISITTSSLPADTINIAYSQTMAATGGTGALTWAISSGTLPTGLSLNASTGAITGTPTAAGTSNFTARATDTVGATGTKALGIVINTALSITTSSLPNGTVGSSYNQTLARTGGTTPFTWAISSGSLPAGLSLVASTGAITGTPTASGTSNFTARVTDNVGATATKALSIIVTGGGALTIATASLPNGTVSVSYNQTLTATGGTTPYTWAISSGSLPAGLSLVASTGVISGTPTASGTSNFTARVTDNVAATATKALSIIVNAASSGQYQFAGNDSEVSTTSTSWQTRTTLTFTPPATDNWVIMAFAEFKGSSTSQAVNVRMTVDASAESQTSVTPPATTDYQSFTTTKFISLNASSHTINLDYASANASATAYLRNARIVAIQKSSLEVYSAAADSQQTLTAGTLTWMVNVDFTPATAGDYLLIWSGETNATTTSYYTQIRNEINYSGTGDYTFGQQATSDWMPFAAFQVVNLAASTQSLNIAGGAQTGTTGTHYIRRARVTAIRLSGSAFAGYQFAQNQNYASTTSSWTQYLTKSWSVGTAGNYLVLSSWAFSPGGAATDVEARLQLNDTTTTAQPIRRGHNDTPYGAAVGVSNLSTGTNFYDVDFHSAAGSYVCMWDAYIAVLPFGASAPLSITTASLPADTVNIAYNQTLAATGGTTPYTWAVLSGSLPAGLSLVAGTGAITGTPTTSGTSNFTARVTDNAAATATKALSIVVNAAPSITTSSLPNGNVGVSYSQTLAATGGTSPLSWALSSGSLPAGLSLVASTGAITGTPTASGTSNFTARVTDNVGATATKALSIVVVSTLTITTSSLPATTVGVAYNQTLTASGGTTPYTWAISSGSLPAGLSLVASTGAITGTPTAAGTSNFTSRVTDNAAATATKALSIVVNPAISITTSSLPADTVSVAYNQTLSATGGTGALTWAIYSGTLPTGLSLNTSTGAITGTPSASGTSNFTVRATDTVSASATKALSIVVNPVPSITTSSLPNGTVGASYNQTLARTGGTTPFTWAISSGSLPAGLSLVASTGVVSGTPTASGTSNFTARVTDNVGATATKALSIVVTSTQSYQYANNDSEVSTTSTSWQTRTTLTFTPPATDYWVVMAFAEFKGSSTSQAVNVRITVDGTTEAQSSVTPVVATDYQSFTTTKYASLSAASHTINLDYASANASATAYLRNARLVAIRKNSLEIYSAAVDGQQTLTPGTLNWVVTSTFTPSTSGDYLLIWSGETNATTTSYYTQVRNEMNYSGTGDYCLGQQATTDWMPFATFQVVNLAASAQSLNIAGGAQSGTNGTHYIRRARVTAIRLTGSSFTGYQFAQRQEYVSTNGSWTQYLTKSWSVGTAGNHLVLSSWIFNGGSSSTDAEARLQLDDTTTLAQPIRRAHGSDTQFGGSVGVSNLATGTNYYDVDFHKASGSYAVMLDAYIVVLPLQ